MKLTPTKCTTCEGAGRIYPQWQIGVVGSGEPFDCPDCDGTGKSKPRIVYHPGDLVRIRKPRFVRRVGYPLVWYEISDEQLYANPSIADALAAFGLQCRALCEGGDKVSDEIPRHLQIAFAKEYVLQHGFGGRERTIHYHEGYKLPLNWQYGPAEVCAKRVVKTGTYFPPYVPGAWAGPDAEGDPGGLGHCKTHVLLDLGSGYEIEACNVEPWK